MALSLTLQQAAGAEGEQTCGGQGRSQQQGGAAPAAQGLGGSSKSKSSM